MCAVSVGDPPGDVPGLRCGDAPMGVGHSRADTGPGRGSDCPSSPLPLRAATTELMEMDPAAGVTVIHTDRRDGSCSGSFPALPRVSGSNTKCSQGCWRLVLDFIANYDNGLYPRVPQSP